MCVNMTEQEGELKVTYSNKRQEVVGSYDQT